MKVLVKRFDKSVAMPGYKSPGAVCMDIYSREEAIIAPGKIAYVPLNIAVQVPKGYWVMIVPRGSTHKLGIMMANSIGIGDEDFCGDGDEYVFPAWNFTNREVMIEKGTRIGQMMVVKHERMEIEEVEHLGNPTRGKLGSTGKY